MKASINTCIFLDFFFLEVGSKLYLKKAFFKSFCSFTFYWSCKTDTVTFCYFSLLSPVAAFCTHLPHSCVFKKTFTSVLEKSEFKDESQFFRFYADEETEGTGTKSKQLQRNDFKLIENILVKSLVVSNTHIHTFTFSHIYTWIRRYCQNLGKKPLLASSFSPEKNVLIIKRFANIIPML